MRWTKRQLNFLSITLIVLTASSIIWSRESLAATESKTATPAARIHSTNTKPQTPGAAEDWALGDFIRSFPDRTIIIKEPDAINLAKDSAIIIKPSADPILIKDAESHFLTDLAPWASLLVATSSLLISIYLFRMTRIQVWYSGRNHYMSALFDIDRHLIQHPCLWSIYGAARPANPQTGLAGIADEEQAKRTAFIFYHINLFDNVYQDFIVFHDVERRASARFRFWKKHDRELLKYWQAWRDWMSRFLTDSDEARMVCRTLIADGYYPDNFRAFLNEMITGIDQKKASQTNNP